MNPTPSPFKKFLVPGLVLVGLIIAGALLFMKGGTVDQGAALFKGVSKTDVYGEQTNNRTSSTISTGIPLQSGAPAPKACKPWSKPWIQVVSPNGGEVFTVGQQVTVKWATCKGGSDDTARIKIATSYGQGAANQIVDVHAQSGSFVITLPATVGSIPVVSGNYYKMLVEYVDNTVGQSTSGQVLSTDSSDNAFTIN